MQPRYGGGDLRWAGCLLTRASECISKKEILMLTKPSKALETFPNPYPDRDYEIYNECPEFTSLCPKTGQPDFAMIKIRYVPDNLCIELRSLKLYLWSYRNEGVYFEKVTNQILDDLVAACSPRWMEVVAEFNVRGGIGTTITAIYEMKKGTRHGLH